MTENTFSYDNEAATYDKTRFGNDMGRHLDYMQKKILESLIDLSGKLVLEVGIGTGRFGTWLAKKGFEVVGIDISKKMLKKTKEKNVTLNVDVEVIIADFHSLPFKKDLFDNCICINVMDHFSSFDEFFKQVRKVIKPQGSLVFNFSNSQSPYLPVATVINLSGHALFKSKILSRWLTFKEVYVSLLGASFSVKSVRGCMIASPIPFGERLVRIVRSINLISERSRLRFFSGSVFVKAETNAS
jgi:ubiquinone/menaquinone biosynthesis C-methylase UbiE